MSGERRYGRVWMSAEPGEEGSRPEDIQGARPGSHRVVRMRGDGGTKPESHDPSMSLSGRVRLRPRVVLTPRRRDRDIEAEGGESPSRMGDPMQDDSRSNRLDTSRTGGGEDNDVGRVAHYSLPDPNPESKSPPNPSTAEVFPDDCSMEITGEAMAPRRPFPFPQILGPAGFRNRQHERYLGRAPTALQSRRGGIAGTTDGVGPIPPRLGNDKSERRVSSRIESHPQPAPTHTPVSTGPDTRPDHSPVARLASMLSALRVKWARMDPRGPWGDFQMDEEVLRAGLLAALVENRSESPRESSDKQMFVFSTRLPTEAGETAEGVPQLQWGSDHPGTLSAALGGPLSVLGGMALEAGFWFVPVHDYETRHWYGVMVRNGGEGADIGGRVMMVSLDSLSRTTTAPSLLKEGKRRVFRRVALMAMELYRTVRGYVPQNWVDFLCEQPSIEIVELSVPQQADFNEWPLFRCGDYVLACLVAVLRYDLGVWESMFHQTDDQPHVILAGRGWMAIRLRGSWRQLCLR
uniref:Uncharacterized protein n=1 Tax=Chromera velia CCMP2878 TaxID=1169474 RepID=A0A0G4HKI8_9ALVE|eukprot:Cvel_28432.t1-p1 / transcript=Cvel_28432.t1 / gene=Cvel_28432 / organism=Chromera_velia_CCMP2878 / gene_product=hypothetical protein / transcript_product=hypothetical protein / location=Cvel_scaffold3721:3548-5104(+) / protein_length=519 / sequence_SO=supercontig / SO=protein_coding / is_pseudo=false